MKSFLQWREGFNATNVAMGARGDQREYGNLAAEGLQDIVAALRTLAEKSPQSYNFIVSKIRSEVQKVDPSSASSVGLGGRRYGSAVKQGMAANSQETGGVK